MGKIICLHICDVKVFLKEVDLIGTYLKYKMVPEWTVINRDYKDVNILYIREYQGGLILSQIKKDGIYIDLKFDKHVNYQFAVAEYRKVNAEGLFLEDHYKPFCCLIPYGGINVMGDIRFPSEDNI